MSRRQLQPSRKHSPVATRRSIDSSNRFARGTRADRTRSRRPRYAGSRYSSAAGNAFSVTPVRGFPRQAAGADPLVSPIEIFPQDLADLLEFQQTLTDTSRLGPVWDDCADLYQPR